MKKVLIKKIILDIFFSFKRSKNINFVNLIVFLILFFHVVNASEINSILKKEEKRNAWHKDNIEKSKDIRNLNIPISYSNFCKIELNDEKGNKKAEEEQKKRRI